jgi:hypothetical protein
MALGLEEISYPEPLLNKMLERPNSSHLLELPFGAFPWPRLYLVLPPSALLEN